MGSSEVDKPFVEVLDGSGLDVELVDFEVEIRADIEASFEFVLEFFDFGSVGSDEVFDDGGVALDEEGGALFVDPSSHVSFDPEADGFDAGDSSSAFAHGAFGGDGLGDGLSGAFAGDFDEAEGGDSSDARAGSVSFEGLFEVVHEFLFIGGVFHVDEVDDDNAAHVSEAELSADFVGGFDVGAEDGVREAGGPDLFSGVDVDGGEGFHLVDDEVAASFEPDLVFEEVVEVFFDFVVVEDGFFLVEEDDFVFKFGGDHAGDEADFFVFVGVVDDESVDFVSEDVSDGAVEEGLVSVDDGGCSESLGGVHDL